MRWGTTDTYLPELFNLSFPAEAEIVGGAYSLNIRGLAAHGQDAQPLDFRGVAGLPAAFPFAADGDLLQRAAGQIQRWEAYRLFGEALRATGRNITYSICPLIAGCDPSVWTYYKDVAHLSMNQCTQKDAQDTWESFEYLLDDNNRFAGKAAAAGPGYWNDLDLLQLGYKNLKPYHPPGGRTRRAAVGGPPLQPKVAYRAQITVFALLAAPLIVSADFRGTGPLNLWTDEMAELLLNREILAISQDALGKQGRLVMRLADGVELYARPMADGDIAVAVLNRRPLGAPPAHAAVRFADLGIAPGRVLVRDPWAKRDLGPRNGSVAVRVQSHDAACLRLRADHV